jgi:hypothetical protein
MRAIRTIVTAMLMLTATAAFAENRFHYAGIDDDRTVYRAFHQLQWAIAHDDRKAASKLFEYPFNVGIERPGASYIPSVEIRTPREFRRRYRWIITPKVRSLILNSKDADLWSNWRGIALGRGQVWFEGQENSDLVKVRYIGHDLTKSH